MEKIYEFVKTMCVKYSIDESHDVSHSMDCVSFAKQLLPEKFSKEETKVVLYACALHDTVDKKYAPPQAIHEVIHFLKSLQESSEIINPIVSIITTISYSFLTSRKEEGLSFPNHEKWQECYHIVRHADLLCSFRVKRSYQYQKHITPTISDEEAKELVKTLFANRIFKYKDNGWITLQKAVELTTVLEQEARADLELL